MTRTKLALLAASGAAAMFAASPASAAIYTYTMINGDVLTIDSGSSSATWVGDTINASMTSSAFAGFTGGASPRFMYVLDSLDGTRKINGQWLTDNPKNSTTTHPQMLKAENAPGGNTKFNLWAWWGDPIKGGDYVRQVAGYTAQVPAPGMLALFGMALAAVGLRRRRKAIAA